jgi:hypothetical protein
MKFPLHILNLEDVANDAELVQSILETKGRGTPNYLELRFLIVGEIPESVIIYAELTDLEKQTWRTDWALSTLRAKAIIEKSHLLTLLPTNAHRIGIPESRFVEHGMEGVILPANARKTKDGRNAWIWIH